MVRSSKVHDREQLLQLLEQLSCISEPAHLGNPRLSGCLHTFLFALASAAKAVFAANQYLAFVADAESASDFDLGRLSPDHSHDLFGEEMRLSVPTDRPRPQGPREKHIAN